MFRTLLGFYVYITVQVYATSSTNSSTCGVCQNAILSQSSTIPPGVLKCAHKYDFHYFCWSRSITNCPMCRASITKRLNPWGSITKICSAGSIFHFESECRRHNITAEKYAEIDAYGICLDAAVKYFRFEFADYLLSKGASIKQCTNIFAKMSEQLVTLTMAENDIAIKWLLQHGASPFYKTCSDNELSAFTVELYTRKSETAMQLLQEYHGDIFPKGGAADRFDALAIMVSHLVSANYDDATMESFYILLEQLLQVMKDLNDNLNAVSVTGSRILHQLIQRPFRYYRDRIFRILLSNGLDPNLQDLDGQTAIYLTQTRASPSIELLQLILNNGGNINVQNVDGASLLHYAARWNLESLAKFLIDHGANTEVWDETGNTPLMVAAANNCKIVFRLLLKAGANINAKDYNGNSLIHVAVKAGSMDSVNLAFESKLSINLANKNGLSPLHFAVQLKNFEIVKLLLQHGADMNLHFGDTESAYGISTMKMKAKLRWYVMHLDQNTITDGAADNTL